MYDEIRKDLHEQYKDLPRKKIPLWGRAMKQLMGERNGPGGIINVSWLARKTGITDKHLFNILAGRIHNPSSDKLLKIADAFNISFAELAQRSVAEHAGHFHVTSFGQRGYIDYAQHGFSIQSLSPPGTSTRDFFLGLMTIKAHKELKRWRFKDNSMVCIFLESGTLEINYGGKIKRLQANESCYFDAGVPHTFRNVDSVAAKLFLVTRPPLH
ncbi:MAG: cupin domain-containing protein [Candidatus Omnitrophica bacterium]|nr:cupin domain-containing protein [Candidatus Omnitrophota bacterium]